MSIFKIVNNASEIKLSNSWVDVPPFMDKIVDEKGKPVSSNYEGRKYRIIAQKERVLSCLERFGRCFIGLIGVIFSLGILLALFFQPMQSLFAKQKEVVCYGVLEQKENFIIAFDSKVLNVINNAQNIPGLKSEEFVTLKTEIAQTWNTLSKDGVLEISAPDKDVRPYYVALQAVIEHLLASELQKEITVLKGFIHTPMPATPLCTKGEISRELVDPSIEADPNRLFTVKARTTIVRDFLFKGGELSIIYPKEGYNKRTVDQRNIYEQELANYPNHLHDIRLECETIPEELIGATYIFQDRSGNRYVFAIKMTQAKDPKEVGNFGLWFGSFENPAIKKRMKAVSTYLEQYGFNALK